MQQQHACRLLGPRSRLLGRLTLPLLTGMLGMPPSSSSSALQHSPTYSLLPVTPCARRLLEHNLPQEFIATVDKAKQSSLWPI